MALTIGVDAMDPEARDRLVRFYERSLSLHGSGGRAVRWLDDASQRRRFEVLAEVGPWDGASVADVGCGLGDLYRFLRESGHRVHYGGFDISPAMVAAARKRSSGPEVRFEVRDPSEDGLPGTFDYVVASGAFNIRTPDHEAFLERMVAAMYAGCRRAVAFNVLRPLPPGDDRVARYEELIGDFYFSIEPARLLDVCRRLTPHVVLRDDYDLGECTVFLYRRAPGPARRPRPPARRRRGTARR